MNENVGEAWYEFRRDDSKLRSEVQQTETAVKDSATRGSNAFTNAFQAGVGKVKSFMSDLGNVAKGFIAIFAAQQVVSFFQDAVTAAREETTSVAQLTASLEANSKAYGGNVDAIERVIEERMALGFADDEQRESLAGLVAITKDHNKALELNRAAMDLARLRNIDLRTASDIMGKVYGGNIGILARYGIQLERGATSTEALAAIQRMASGQAEAWAATEEGAAQTAGLAMGELTEDIGSLLLPMLTHLSMFTRDVVVPALRQMVEWIGNIGEFIGPAVDGIGKFIDNVGDDIRSLQIYFGDLGKTVEDRANAIGVDVGEMKDAFAYAVNEMGLSVEDAMEYAENAARGLPPVMTDAARQSLAAWKQEDLSGGVKATLVEGATAVGEGAEAGIVEPTKEQLAAAEEAAKASARAMTADYASEIAGGADDVTQAWDALLKGAENEMSETARIAEINAMLVSPKLREALQSEDPYLRAQAVATKETLLEQLALLEAGAVDRAVRTGQSLPDALAAHQHDTQIQAAALANRALNELGRAPAGASASGAGAGSGFASGVGSAYYVAGEKGRNVGANAVTGLNSGGSGAYAGGASIGGSWMRGITSAIAAANPELNRHINWVKMQLGGSLPEAGPLKGDTAAKGGESIGEAWGGHLAGTIGAQARRIADQVGRVRDVLRSYAAGSSPSPAFIQPSVVQAYAGLADTAGGGPVTTIGGITIHINGYNRDPRELSRALTTELRLRLAAG